MNTVVDALRPWLLAAHDGDVLTGLDLAAMTQTLLECAYDANRALHYGIPALDAANIQQVQQIGTRVLQRLDESIGELFGREVVARVWPNFRADIHRYRDLFPGETDAAVLQEALEQIVDGIGNVLVGCHLVRLVKRVRYGIVS